MKYFIQRLALLTAFFVVSLSSYGQSPFTGISVETLDNSSGLFTNGEVTYRVYAELSSGVLTQVFADETRPLSVVTTTEFFNMGVFGSIVNFQNQANTGAFGFIAQHEYDSWITFGDSYTDGPGVIGDVGLTDNLVGNTWSFGGSLNSDAALFRTPDDLLAAPQDGLILLAQFTTNGDLSGVLNLSGLDSDGNPWEAIQVEFSTGSPSILGCTDPTACNFDELANEDDQSCLYSTSSLTNITTSESFDWNGETYSTSGEYTYQTIGSNGCDSIATLNLTFLGQSPFTGIFVETLDNSSGLFTNGEVTYRVYAELSSGVLTQVFADETRPLSVVTTTEFFNMGVFGSIVNFQNQANTGAFGFIAQHEYDSWITFGDSYTDGPGVIGDVGLTDNLVGNTWSFGGSLNSDAALFRTPDDLLAAPQDGLILLAQFTTNGDLSGVLNLSGLDSDGNPWEAIQVEFSTGSPSILGCTDPTACNFDELANEDDQSCLYSSSSSSDEVACESYDWNGETYSTSGEYTYQTIGSNGCDSIATLNLTINNSTSSFDDVTACDSFDWNGETYSTSGEYTYQTIGSNGCDSIATLNLTINNSTSSFDDVTACESFRLEW
jgi:adhesin HecA-like repeat protein